MLTPQQIAEMDAIAGVKTPTPVNATQSIAQKRAQEIQERARVARETQRKENRTMKEKVADFTGGKEIATGIGEALARGGEKGTSKMLEDVQNSQIEIQSKLLQRIKEKKELGEDTSRLQTALEVLTEGIGATGEGAERFLNPSELTGKQVIGDFLQLASTASAGNLARGAANVAGKVTGGGVGIARGAAQGALAGAGSGAIVGATQGAAQGLQEDKDAKGVLKDAKEGALIGGVSGGILGGAIGGVSGGLKGRELRKEVLNQQISSGEKPVINMTNMSPQQKKTIEIARQQGIDDVDTQFIQSMKPADKMKADRMISLAEKASVDKRAIERPIDVVGESMLERVKFIESQNKSSGKAVDATAKALKGNLVDATPVRERALGLLEDIGVTANNNGTPNWSKSIFKKTPELEKKIMKALSDLPAGEIDAYDLHNFKKSIDEVVDYGVGGEGLKGESASILKAIRNSADEVLDSTFDDYNKANTDFKVTKEVLDEAKDLFGKKAGFAKERGGQLLRSVFSNNTQRPRVLKMIENLDNTSKLYGKVFEDNLVDQALFTEILEDIYGTQATTSLQGQVERAVHGGKKVIEGLRDPIKGIGELLATSAEKMAGISPENKKKVLLSLLRN